MSGHALSTLLVAFELGLARAARPRRLLLYAAAMALTLLLAAYLRLHPELWARAAPPVGDRVPVQRLADVVAATPPEVSLFGALLARLFLSFGVVGVAIALTSDAFASDVERATLPLILARSTPRWAYFLGRRIACDVVALALAVPTTVALFAITCAGSPDHWVAYCALLTSALAVLAYDSVFAVISLTPRAALAIGLVYGFVWEILLPDLNERVRLLVVAHYLRSFITRAIVEDRTVASSHANADTALLVLALVIVAATVLGAVLFDRRGQDLRSA